MSTSTHTGSTTSQTGGQDKLAALHEQISDGVAALVESQGWRAMLDTAAKFHSYRLGGNLLLIGAQAPQATRVAGFRAWQSLGRQVRKGERGIAILAPCTYRPKAADRAEPAAPAGPEPATSCSGGAAPQGAGGGRQVRGFRVVHVFDLSQTEGAPLPEVAPALLVGQAPAGLWDAMEGQVLGHGYTVHRGDTGRANGWTDPTTRTVRVSGAVDDAQAVKTLIHDLAHLEAGHVTDLPTYANPWRRLVRTAEYVATTVYGTASEAEQAASHVRRLHGQLSGIEPLSGTPYRGDDPGLLRCALLRGRINPDHRRALRAAADALGAGRLLRRTDAQRSPRGT